MEILTTEFACGNIDFWETKIFVKGGEKKRWQPNLEAIIVPFVLSSAAVTLQRL
jgi:hypothetical protein